MLTVGRFLSRAGSCTFRDVFECGQRKLFIFKKNVDGAWRIARCSFSPTHPLVAAPVAGLHPDLASEIVAGVVLRIGPMLASRSPESVEAAVAAILRTVGQDPASAAALAVEALTYARADIEAHETEARRTG